MSRRFLDDYTKELSQKGIKEKKYMTIYELVRCCRLQMEILHKNEVMITDFKHMDVYEEYLRMKGEGAKVTYIVAVLSAKHNLGERREKR